MTNTTHHIDEQTLTRFAMNDETLNDGERFTIQQHLRSCEGCQALFNQIDEFYANVDTELEQNKTLGERHKKELMKLENIPSVWTEPLSAIVPQIPKESIAKLWYFSRKYPVVTSGYIIGLFALTFILFFQFTPQTLKDRNPAEVFFDSQKKQYKILNKQREELWALNWFGDGNYTSSDVEKSTKIADLDNDGKNEVITVAFYLDSDPTDKNVMKIYNADGTLRLKKKYGKTMIYNKQIITNDFTLRNLLVEDFDGDGIKEFYIGMANNHSPYALLKIDQDGNTIGEFWHYGHYWEFYATSFGSKHKQIILCGISDVDSLQRAIITIINPNKLSGICQSSSSPHFGFSFTSAEQSTIEFPRTVIDDKFQTKPRVAIKTFEQDSLIGFEVRSVSSIPTIPYNSFEYIFDVNWLPVEVKAYDSSRQLFRISYNQGKILFPLTESYLNELKRKVKSYISRPKK